MAHTTTAPPQAAESNAPAEGINASLPSAISSSDLPMFIAGVADQVSSNA